MLSARTSVIIYVAMIPLYALIYAALPENFYHTTIAHEPSTKRDASEISDALRDRIAEGIRSTFKADTARFGNIEIGWPRISELSAKDGALFFLLSFGKQSGDDFAVLHFHVRLQPESMTLLWDRSGNHEFVLSCDEPSQHGIRLMDICPRRSVKPISAEENNWILNPQGFVILPYSVQTKIHSYIRTQSGFPSNTWENVGRMFYFSAVTITTVGFGDILPLTGLARILVASEAILGVVIIGIFINAVSKSKPRPVLEARKAGAEEQNVSSLGDRSPPLN